MLLSNFSTALSDILLATNNRPLTFRDKDNDLEVVTPNHISTGVSFPSLIISEEFIPGDIEEEDIRDNLLNSLEMRDIVISKFRNEWYDNYLLSLREKHKNSYCSDDFSQGRSEYLKVGSVVIIKSSVKPRPFWTIGKIIQLLHGDDEYIRVAKVLKPDKSIITTLVTNLYPLELDCHNLEDDEDNLIPEPALGNNLSLDSFQESDISPSDIEQETDEPLPADDSLAGPSGVQSFGAAEPATRPAEKFKQNMKQWIDTDAI